MFLRFLRKDTNTLDVKRISEILHWDRQCQRLEKKNSPSQNHSEEQLQDYHSKLQNS